MVEEETLFSMILQKFSTPEQILYYTTNKKRTINLTPKYIFGLATIIFLLVNFHYTYFVQLSDQKEF